MKRIVLLLILAQPSWLFAQEGEGVRIVDMRLGFASSKAAETSAAKVGLWAPVYVTLEAGKGGFPGNPKGTRARLLVEAPDSEDLGAIYPQELAPLGPSEKRTVLSYARLGNMGSAVKISVQHEGRTAAEETLYVRLPNLGSLLAVSLGGAVEGLAEAFEPADERDGPGGMRVSKSVGMLTTVEQLPELAMGYDGCDIIFLCGAAKNFLKDLDNPAHFEKLKALAQYVRKGGKLVIGVAWEYQTLLHPILTSDAWQPPLPVVPPADAGDIKSRTVKRLVEVEPWGGVERPPFQRDKEGIVVARLDPGRVDEGQWDVLVKSTAAGLPLITRMSYGLGTVWYFAFPFDDGAFKTWGGNKEFLKNSMVKLTSREAVMRTGGSHMGNDVASELQRNLDQFDVQVVPFGLVALFLLLYILVVGPLDFFVLKYLGKLEWTWFTFPAVVLIVSVAAYYTAYALKGNDQKINQVDVIEIDLRTGLDEKLNTAKPYILGRSYFTVLSPRIQAYTVGVRPNPAFFGVEKEKVGTAQPVSWFGRPDDQAWGMGRRGSPGLFRKPYRYAPDAAGLDKVPVAVWTTKSFSAEWELMPSKPPIEAHLVYHQKGDTRIRGTFVNHLPLELEDVWFLYGDRCFPLDRPIPSSRTKKDPVQIALETHESRDLNAWHTAAEPPTIYRDRTLTEGPLGTPTSIVKGTMFHDKLLFTNRQNHLLRSWDLSWRLEPKTRGFGIDTSLREVIVYARLKHRYGPADVLARDASQPLPTELWLGELPAADRTQPTILGTLAQNTYLRICLPLHSADRVAP